MRILFAFMTIIIGFFLFMFLVGAGVLASVFGRLFGGRKKRPDPVMLQNLAALSPGEAALVSDSLRRADPAIVNLSDQTAIDGLLAKGIVVQSADQTGVIDYRIDETLWDYLRYNRPHF